MLRQVVISLIAATSLLALAPQARAHDDHQRYASAPKVSHYQGHGHKYGYGHRHWNRFDRRFVRQALRHHDRHWRRDCRYRDRYHEHVRIGGRVVIQF